jgi:predicted nucleic acid-binding protein
MSASFIDSNVFVYLLDERSHDKTALARQLVRDGLERLDAVISFQVVQETLNVVTRRIPAPLTAHDAAGFLGRFLAPLWQVMPSADLYRRGLEIQERYGFSFYDALIVAAALSAGCTTLYSEDFQHGQRIERLTVVNPFLG